MNRILAERIVNAIEDFKEPFNTLDALSDEIENEGEKRAFRLLIAPPLRQFPGI